MRYLIGTRVYINEIRKAGVEAEMVATARLVSRRCMKNVQECVVRVRIVIHQGENCAVWLPAEGERDDAMLFFGGGRGFRNAVRTPQG